nr:CDP-diacylglycerol--serine O-phosphatidyltransferase 1 isoform X3 [Ipomoea batatas]
MTRLLLRPTFSKLRKNRDDARQFMKYLHPDLGVELPERSYGADCRIYVPENPTNRSSEHLVSLLQHNWDKDEWHPLLGPWRFLQVLSLCVVFLTVELNTFFLKFCLWVPPQNPLIIYRLVLWWLIAIPTIREYNSYLQDSAMESLVCSRTRRVEDDHPQAGVIPSLLAASVWCSNDDVHPAYPYQESPVCVLVLALPVPNHHDQEEIRKLSVCSTTATTTVEYHPQAAVNPPLSASSVWCFNDDVHPYPLVLALPVPSHHHHQEEITKLTLFTRSEEDHPTAAPTIEDHLPIKKRKRSIIIGPKKPQNNSIQNPKKPIKNDHRWDDELIDAASSLSLSLPTKRKRLPKPKKPENSSIQEKEEEGVIIAKRQKKVATGAVGNHNHHHWIQKRLSKSDVNLSSRLLLPKEEITKYVLPLMNMESCRACQNKDGLRVKIWDLDTESEHELSLKQWVTGSFLLTSNWNKEFVKRRSLHEGDTISMCWDFENLRFLFRKFNA